jgi:ribosomal protein S2
VILGLESVTLRRYAAGTRDSNGRFTPGALTTSTIQASVQPMTDRDLRTLPEGERQLDQKKVYTTTEIRTGSQHDGTTADQLVVGGVTYEVRQVEQQRSVLPHYKGRIVRVQEAAA